MKKRTSTIRKTLKPKKSRVPKTRNSGTMTESEFWSMIRAALRARTRWWKPRLICLSNARRPSQSENKRLKWEFLCAECKDFFPQKMIEVHHSQEAGSLTCNDDLSGFVTRLFAEDGWICLCKDCHKKKHN